MKRPILAASLCLGITSTQAFAVDWSLNSSLSEAVELNSNQFLSSPSAGGTIGSYSTLTANAVARTPTSRFIFDGDVTYQKYWGPGTAATPQSEFRQDGVKARYETFGKDPTDLNYAEMILRQSSTALAVLNNLGLATNAQGFLDTSTVRGGIERNLTSLDFTTLTARSTYTNYDPPSGGTSFTDSSVIGTWRHRVNSSVALTASSELEWLNYNTLPNSSVMILRDQTGIDATLSSYLSFRGTAGAAYVVPNQNAAAALPTFSSGTVSSGSSVGFITDMLLTYRMLKNTTITFSGTQTIGPSVVGSLNQTTTIATGVIYNINNQSSLSFAASASRQTSASSSDFYLGSATYSYQLTREWNTQLTYRFLHRTASTGQITGGIFDPISGIPIVSGGGAANSNSIMAVVTRSFSVLPAGN